MKSADPFYKSGRWERLRSSALRRDLYMCQCCAAHNLMVPAQCVHHVFPRDAFKDYQYELWNCMSLCYKCHDEMHNRYTGQLSKKGMLFMQALAAARGIKINMSHRTILVIGLRGCGKSTYCKSHLDDYTLCYDMDAIASAFRLKMPHEEYYKPARRMANDFLRGFLVKAHDYCKRVLIIRTAPSIKEFEEIDPDKVVICKHRYVDRPMDDKAGALERIAQIEERCRVLGIDLELLE